MLNIGMGELTVLLLIAFIVVGPSDLPKVAVSIAKAIKYIRRMIKEVMSSIDIDGELTDLKEMKETIEVVADPKSILRPVTQELSDVSKITKQEMVDISKAAKPVTKEDLSR